MSFGFSVGDFLHGLMTAKKVYQACKDGPKEYREIANEAKSIQFAINCLCEDAKNLDSLLNAKGVDRKDELMEIINNCKVTMEDFQVLVDKRSVLKDNSKGGVKRIWHAYRIGSANLDSIRGKFTLHASCIHCFLQSLEGPSLVRIEQKIDMIYTRMVQDDAREDSKSVISCKSTASRISVLSQIESNEEDAWDLIKKELLAENISMVQLMAHKDTIIDHVKSLITYDFVKPLRDGTDPLIVGDGVEKSSPFGTAITSDSRAPIPATPSTAPMLQSGGFKAVAKMIKCSNGIYGGEPVSMIVFDVMLDLQEDRSTLRQYDMFELVILGSDATHPWQTAIEQKGTNVLFKEVAQSKYFEMCWESGFRTEKSAGHRRQASVFVFYSGYHCSRPRRGPIQKLRVGLIVTHRGLPFTLSLQESGGSHTLDLPVKPQPDRGNFLISPGDLQRFVDH